MERPPPSLRGADPVSCVTLLANASAAAQLVCCMCGPAAAEWVCGVCDAAFCKRCFLSYHSHGPERRVAVQDLVHQEWLAETRGLPTAPTSPRVDGVSLASKTAAARFMAFGLHGVSGAAAGTRQPARRQSTLVRPDVLTIQAPSDVPKHAAGDGGHGGGGSSGGGGASPTGVTLRKQIKCRATILPSFVVPESHTLAAFHALTTSRLPAASRHWAVRVHVCSECGFQAAAMWCDWCGDVFCDGCFTVVHRRGQLLEHTFAPLVPLCESCNVRAATLRCGTCQADERRRHRRLDPHNTLNLSVAQVLARSRSGRLPYVGDDVEWTPVNQRAGCPDDWAGEESFFCSGGFCSVACFHTYHVDLAAAAGVDTHPHPSGAAAAGIDGATHFAKPCGFQMLETADGQRHDWARNVLVAVAQRLELQERRRRREKYAERRTRMAIRIQRGWRHCWRLRLLHTQLRGKRLEKIALFEAEKVTRLNVRAGTGRTLGLLVDKFSWKHVARETLKRKWRAVKARMSIGTVLQMFREQEAPLETAQVNDWMRMGGDAGDSSSDDDYDDDES